MPHGFNSLGRFAAVDVYYPETGGAIPALIVAADPEFSNIIEEHTARLADAAPYQPGAFFERELPALRAILSGVASLDLLVVDGYVELSPDGHPGLGAFAHKEFGVPVIGAAKTRFHGATHAIEVQRGTARRPLWVTAAGLFAKDAADLIQHMSGPYRMPDALRRVDWLSRNS